MSENNPYQVLGKFEPFNFLGIGFMLDEALKKVLCAGMEGRKKTAEQDLKEAVYSLKRAIKASAEGDVYLGKASSYTLIDISELIGVYGVTLRTPLKQLNAAQLILIFMQNGNRLLLRDAIEALR